MKDKELMEFVKKSLRPKEFKLDRRNDYLAYLVYNSKWGCVSDYCFKRVGVVYLEFLIPLAKLIKELEREKVTPEQLHQAYKELGWV